MSEQPGQPKNPIPREFHSEYEDRPFRACSQCGEPLAAFRHYQINKAWRNGECVFEYVFCEVCRDRMLEEFSEESKSNLMRHQEKHLRDVHGTGECAFCGRSAGRVTDARLRDHRALQRRRPPGQPHDLRSPASCRRTSCSARRRAMCGGAFSRIFRVCRPTGKDCRSRRTRRNWPAASAPQARGHARSKRPRRCKPVTHDPAALMACVELIWAKASGLRIRHLAPPRPDTRVRERAIRCSTLKCRLRFPPARRCCLPRARRGRPCVRAWRDRGWSWASRRSSAHGARD